MLSLEGSFLEGLHLRGDYFAGLNEQEPSGPMLDRDCTCACICLVWPHQVDVHLQDASQYQRNGGRQAFFPGLAATAVTPDGSWNYQG